MGNKHINKIKKDKIKKDEKKEKIVKNETIQKAMYKYNILFVGEAGIGTKTSLIKRIKEGKFIESTGDNKEINQKLIYEKDNKEIIFYLIDTNTEKEKSYLNETNVDKIKNNPFLYDYYKNADCIIMGYDVTNKQSFEQIKSFLYNKIKEKTKTNLIYLLGNKIDLKDNIDINENEIKEFTDTNKIKHFSISVKDDINIQNLIDDIKLNTENINNNINNGINEIIYGNPSKENYKITVLANSGVGTKTSLLRALNNRSFEENSPPTTFSFAQKIIDLKNGNTISLNFIDTAGHERYISLMRFGIKDSDIVILGYDITRKGSFEDIDKIWYPLTKEVILSDLIYLLSNKNDVKDMIEVDEEEARKYAKDNKMRFFPISCKNFTGIKEFLDDITDEIIKM